MSSTVKEKKIEILKKFQSEQLKIVNDFKDNDYRSIEELPLKEFLAILYFSNAQFNAPCFERRMILKGWKKNKAADEIGDFYVPILNKNIELKISFPNKADTINIRQIRPWQNCDYAIVYCDYINYNHKVLYLTHEQMKLKIDEHGCQTHGTKESIFNNKKVEYSLTIKRSKFDEWKEFENKNLLDFIFSD